MNSPVSISRAARQIRDGDLRPIELVEQCLDRIDALEERLQAWVIVDSDGARQAAEQLGREAAEGHFRGPLHGIPLGIKDIFDMAGFPTEAGSPLRQQHTARVDAPAVRSLRQAGAILLGKTVTVEFACFDPSPTLNPWDPQLRHTPGGSSSGSAVAVATGMCLGALGSQTGGSLVRPASYCGIATCKPTFGRISRCGVVPVSYHLDHVGPMARSVADLRILLDCLVQEEAQPPSEPVGPPRLGLLEPFFMEQADASVGQVTEAALQKLRQAGATVEPVTFDGGFEQIRAMHLRIMGVEAATYHRANFPDHRDQYGPKIASLLDAGLATSAVDYAAALADQRRFRRRAGSFFADVDALVMPSTDTPAPADLTTTGTPLFQAPWSCAGVPVVSIPSGLATDDMPVGLQLVGPAYQEDRLLQIAGWCEAQIAFDAAPPVG